MHCNVLFFYKFISLMPVHRLERKRKGSSKNRNAIWRTCNWLKVLQTSKMKTRNQFQGCCQCSSLVCLHRSFAIWKWVDVFIGWTNLLTDRGVTRIDGARGKKQLWRPHVRTWGLSEANVLYWRKCLWHCWDFLGLHNHSAPVELRPPFPLGTPLLIEP